MCMYPLLVGKTRESNDELLSAVVAACLSLGYNPDPTTIITDFEMAVMHAVSDVLGQHMQHRRCFYHLTQSTWRKVIVLLTCT